MSKKVAESIYNWRHGLLPDVGEIKEEAPALAKGTTPELINSNQSISEVWSKRERTGKSISDVWNNKVDNSGVMGGLK